jgi:hypothetical protein
MQINKTSKTQQNCNQTIPSSSETVILLQGHSLMRFESQSQCLFEYTCSCLEATRSPTKICGRLRKSAAISEQLFTNRPKFSNYVSPNLRFAMQSKVKRVYSFNCRVQVSLIEIL